MCRSDPFDQATVMKYWLLVIKVMFQGRFPPIEGDFGTIHEGVFEGLFGVVLKGN